MISTGLQELNSEQDLNIVRTTLRLDQASENEALETLCPEMATIARNNSPDRRSKGVLDPRS